MLKDDKLYRNELGGAASHAVIRSMDHRGIGAEMVHQSKLDVDFQHAM